MSHFARSRPSPAMVVAVIALSFALAGSAVAGTDAVISDVSKKKVKKISKQQAKKQINKRAVTLGGVAGGDLAGTYPDPLIGDQKVTAGKIDSDAVTTAKIAPDAVTEPKIADAAVGTNKIADDAVTSAKVAADAVGSSEIAAGAVTGSKLGSVTTRSASDSIPSGTSGIVAVSCQGGETRLSGGGFFDAVLQANKGLQASFAFGNLGWAVVGRNNTGVAQTLNAQVLCLQ